MGLRSDGPLPEALAGVTETTPARLMTAEAYWRRLVPHLKRFGISRVADITGLDHIGFPVAQAIRPWACSNAVTQGKAATLAGAAVGAVLECLEMAAGENLEALPDAPPGDAMLWQSRAGGAAWPDDRTRYVAAWDLRAGARASVPRDLMSTDFSQGAAAQVAPIVRHSIGLGAGAGLSDAVWHGLMEAIEADARIRAEAGGWGPRLALSPDDPDYGLVLRAVTQAGLRAVLTDMPCAGGLTAVAASVMESPGASALPLPASGFAARPTPGAAIAAALAEAVQARLAVISGAREDLTQRVYAHERGAAALDAEWAWHGPAPGVAPRAAAQGKVGWRTILEAVGPVYAVPLVWRPEVPLAITRVVAPGLVSDPWQLEARP